MIKCEEFYNALIEKEIDFFTGVPDSLLSDFTAYIEDNAPKNRHVIAANEGNAVALATGYYLARDKLGLVYMQNSGEGNAINPLTSLTDSEVYGIPMILLIGWRGEPGIKDEPQHIKQGKVTLSLLETLNVPYSILPDSIREARLLLEESVKRSRFNKIPCAFVVRNGTFERYELKNRVETNYGLSREEAIKLAVDSLNEEDVVVSTTGKISRELFEYREKKGQGHGMDFLTVGSMGHASQIALGIVLVKQGRQVYCFDGDGAAIMHMGGLAIIGARKCNNFKHIVFNNGSHDSVGGQPTVGFDIDFVGITKSCGYKNAWRTETRNDTAEKLEILRKSEGPSLLEILINKGARKDLGRPTTTPKENKEAFMENLKK